jgi:superfamily II DNA or RNA helicase
VTNYQTLRFDKGTLLLESRPSPHIANYFTWDKRAEAWRCDALHYTEVENALIETSPACSVNVTHRIKVNWPRANLSTLRNDQQSALQEWMKLRRGVLVMPTGTGKTEVALHIMHRLSVSTLVVSPVRDLMYQWHQRIQDRLGYDAGIIGDNIFNKHHVSVTTYDSACIHMQDFGDEFDLLIFDECHHLPGQVRSDAARMSTAPYRLGLTATPERSDGREAVLDSLIGPIAFRSLLSEAKGRILADYDVKRIPVYLTPEERKKYDRCSDVIRYFMGEQRKTDPNYSFVELRKEYAKSPQVRQVLQAFYMKESIAQPSHRKLEKMCWLNVCSPATRQG